MQLSPLVDSISNHSHTTKGSDRPCSRVEPVYARRTTQAGLTRTLSAYLVIDQLLGSIDQGLSQHCALNSAIAFNGPVNLFALLAHEAHRSIEDGSL